MKQSILFVAKLSKTEQRVLVFKLMIILSARKYMTGLERR
jgi:hypothetical protein